MVTHDPTTVIHETFVKCRLAENYRKQSTHLGQ